jgi:AraC-like DNA-binding protein
MYLLTISENILLYIAGFGILQGFFLAAVICFHPKAQRSSTVFLAPYIICISIPMFLPLAQYLFSWHTYIFLAPFALLQGPLLYLYVRSFKETITWKKAWPHFVLFLVYFFIIGWVSVGLGRNYPAARNMPGGVLHNPFTIIPISFRYVQMLFYYFLARKELNSYQRSIRHLFSETSHIDLSWMRLLINGYVILVFAAIGLYSVVLRYAEYYSLLVLINAAIVSPYIYMAAFKGIYQPAIWQVQPGMNKEKVEEEMRQAEKIKLIKSKEEQAPLKKTIMDAKIEKLVTRIISLIEQDKIYTEPELNLQQLAEKLQAPSYQVSLAINEGLQKNFYEFINAYRVEEAKKLLLDSKNKNFTILSVGFEAGFNSKTTFNTVFKKFTGLTPTQFREKEKRIQVAV